MRCAHFYKMFFIQDFKIFLPDPMQRLQLQHTQQSSCLSMYLPSLRWPASLLCKYSFLFSFMATSLISRFSLSLQFSLLYGLYFTFFILSDLACGQFFCPPFIVVRLVLLFFDTSHSVFSVSYLFLV